MQRGIVPPIPNLKEPDPELGNLRLSQGGEYPVEYAVRLAAGFGSQLALALWKRIAKNEDRTDAATHLNWRKRSPAREHPNRSGSNTYRVMEGESLKTELFPPCSKVSSKPRCGGTKPRNSPHKPLGDHRGKTGYEPDDIESDMELEADLGIDTVKQAEIFSEVRDGYNIERDDSFVLADYPTIQDLADGCTPKSVPHQVSMPPAQTKPKTQLSKSPQSPRWKDQRNSPHKPLGDHRGEDRYEPDDIESDMELEADLGIDTVKQAEIFSELRRLQHRETTPLFSPTTPPSRTLQDGCTPKSVPHQASMPRQPKQNRRRSRPNPSQRTRQKDLPACKSTRLTPCLQKRIDPRT